MCRIPDLLGEQSRSSWPIKKAGVAQIDCRLRNVALARQRDALEADQYSDAQKFGNVSPLGPEQTATKEFFIKPIARTEH
jgi:hypothetical protein